MFVTLSQARPTCSGCGLTLFETVHRGHAGNMYSFKRCLNCGHAGPKRWLHPEARPPAVPQPGGYSLNFRHPELF